MSVRTKAEARAGRRRRVRRTVRGTDKAPRLCVFKSLKYTYAQLISDDSGTVLGAADSRGVKSGEKGPSSVGSAKIVGQKIAEIAKEKKLSKVVFDRNGYAYHGRVAAVAEGAREAGLKF